MSNTLSVRSLFLVGLCLLPLTLTACGQASFKWREEVRLSGESLIVIERTARGKLSHRFGSSRGSYNFTVSEMTLRIPRSDPGRTWPPKWRTSYTPILLEYDASNATWSVVAVIRTCTEWKNLGRPSLPYLEFQSRLGGAWKQVGLQPSRYGQAANLLLYTTATRDFDLVREKNKEELNREFPDEYKRISRKWVNNC